MVQEPGELLGVQVVVCSVLDEDPSAVGQHQDPTGVGDRLDGNLELVGDVDAGPGQRADGAPVRAGVTPQPRPQGRGAGGPARTDGRGAEELVDVDLQLPAEGERGDLVGPRVTRKCGTVGVSSVWDRLKPDDGDLTVGERSQAVRGRIKQGRRAARPGMSRQQSCAVVTPRR